MGIVNKRRPHLSSFLEPSLCYTFALDPPASLLIPKKVTAHQNQIDPRPPHQVTLKKILTLSFSKQNFKNCVDGPTAVLLPVLPLPPSINRHRGRPLGYVRFLITNLTLLLR